MKLIKISFVIAIAALAIVGLSGTSYAFHDGGVAYCEGCHTMHNSLQGTAMKVAGGAGDAKASNIFLLQGVDQSSTCLNCHGKDSNQSSYHISTKSVVLENNGPHQAPVNETPGGDFAWVKIGYQSTSTLAGERHGHNIVASDFGYIADQTNTKAPGALSLAVYPAANLSCISCHDPHPNARMDSTDTVVYRNTANTFPTIEASGSYGAAADAGQAVGVYRILGGRGYYPRSLADASIGHAFDANTDPPLAVAPSTYNRTEASSDTHVAYGSGMSQWCANCHADFLNTSNTIGTGGHGHPAGAQLDTTIMNNYNAYVMSGNMTGDGSNSYWSLVPVEEGSATTRATLATHATNTAAYGYTAATTNSQVMCLSCHRAHATAFNSMIRWYNNDSFVTENGAYVTNANGVAPNTDAQASKAYYDRPASKFAAFQRVLCNKCHAKD